MINWSLFPPSQGIGKSVLSNPETIRNGLWGPFLVMNDDFIFSYIDFGSSIIYAQYLMEEHGYLFFANEPGKRLELALSR
jgi:hypothetical protein